MEWLVCSGKIAPFEQQRVDRKICTLRVAWKPLAGYIWVCHIWGCFFLRGHLFCGFNSEPTGNPPFWSSPKKDVHPFVTAIPAFKKQTKKAKPHLNGELPQMAGLWFLVVSLYFPCLVLLFVSPVLFPLGSPWVSAWVLHERNPWA